MTNWDPSDALLIDLYRKKYKELETRRTALEKTCPPDNATDEEHASHKKAEDQFFADQERFYAELEKFNIPIIFIVPSDKD